MRSVQYGCLLALLLAGCQPSEQQRAKWAEEKRIECLDKLCEGDKPPQPQPGMVSIKLNGQWFVGPEEYFSSGINGASFEWWDHKPLSRSMRRQQKLKSWRGTEVDTTSPS